MKSSAPEGKETISAAIEANNKLKKEAEEHILSLKAKLKPPHDGTLIEKEIAIKAEIKKEQKIIEAIDLQNKELQEIGLKEAQIALNELQIELEKMEQEGQQFYTVTATVKPQYANEKILPGRQRAIITKSDALQLDSLVNSSEMSLQKFKKFLENIPDQEIKKCGVFKKELEQLSDGSLEIKIEAAGNIKGKVYIKENTDGKGVTFSMKKKKLEEDSKKIIEALCRLAVYSEPSPKAVFTLNDTLPPKKQDVIREYLQAAIDEKYEGQPNKPNIIPPKSPRDTTLSTNTLTPK